MADDAHVDVLAIDLEPLHAVVGAVEPRRRDVLDLPLALRHAEHVHARGEEQAHHHGHRQRHQRVPDLARLGPHL